MSFSSLNVKEENKCLFLSNTGWEIKAVKFVMVKYLHWKLLKCFKQNAKNCIWYIDREKICEAIFSEKWNLC